MRISFAFVSSLFMLGIIFLARLYILLPSEGSNLFFLPLKYEACRIEYILEENLLEKSVKRPFCCTVSILQVYFTYLSYITFWALKHHFIQI